MLKRLLTAKDEAEKDVINKITSCIKFVHQNYDIEPFRFNRLYHTLIKEFKGRNEPTHVPEEIFLKHATMILKLPTLANTRFFEKLRVAIIDDEESQKNDGEGPAMFWVKYIKLFADLYQFLPSKKNGQPLDTATPQLGRGGRNLNSGLFNTIAAGSTLDNLA